MRKKFGMFTPAGDKLIYSMVATVKRRIKSGETRERVMEYLNSRWAAIEKKHGEATDSEVRDSVLLDLRNAIRRGYGT